MNYQTERAVAKVLFGTLWATVAVIWLTLAFTCTPIQQVVEPERPLTLGELLDQAAGRPPPVDADVVTRGVLRAELAPAMAEPIYELRAFPPEDQVVSTSTVEPPPQVIVHLLPRRDDVLRSSTLTIWFTTGGEEGVSERDAWLVFSPTLLEEPVNWNTVDEPVLQLVPFDVVLPFPGLQVTDYGPRFHRQPTSGIVEVHGQVRLTAPMYVQLVVEAPEENELGYVATHAYGLIPGGE